MFNEYTGIRPALILQWLDDMKAAVKVILETGEKSNWIGFLACCCMKFIDSVMWSHISKILGRANAEKSVCNKRHCQFTTESECTKLITLTKLLLLRFGFMQSLVGIIQMKFHNFYNYTGIK